MKGNLEILNNIDFCNEISNITNTLIMFPTWSLEQQKVADMILRISNIAYNNTSQDVLPLDDGLYDQLLVLYKNYNPNYQVGAAPILFTEQPQNEFEEQKVMCVCIDEKEMESKLYIEDIWKQHTPITQIRPKTMCFITRDPITKRLINTVHKYPELVGTLDKCKFVLNNDAIEKNVFDKPAVQVLNTASFEKKLAPLA